MSGIYPKLDSPSANVKKTVDANTNEPVQVSSAQVPDYKDPPGPLQKRECRDILFLILFILFWAGMAVISVLAIRNGNLDRLKYGNDTEGNLCGTLGKRDLRSMPFAYYFNPFDAEAGSRCVTMCPDQWFQLVCKYDVQVPDSADPISQATAVSNKTCFYGYRSTAILNRCVPHVDILTKFGGNSSQTVTQTRNVASEVFMDIYNSWKVILICVFVALGISFFWLFLVQWFGKFMIWTTLILINVVMFGFTGYVWWSWWNVKRGKEAAPFLSSFNRGSENNELTLQIIGIVSAVVATVIFLIIIALRNRIKLAIAIIEETSKAIRSMPLIVFFPIFKYIGIVALIAWTIYIWAMLATSGSVIAAKISDQANSKLNQTLFEPDKTLQGLSIYYVLGFFWTYNWIVAIWQCTIAGAVATWYWTRDKKALPSVPVLRSFWRTLRYHLGSLAFGSLIIAICQTIQVVLAYIQNYLKKNQASRLAKFCVGCLQCCFACLERVLKFISKNAYIEIAVYGYSFCTAARTVFSLLTRNAVRLVVVDGVGDFLFFLGKLLVTFATSIVALGLLQQSVVVPGVNEIDVGRFWSIPLILVAINSYMIASAFMTVFEMAVNTLFICFCEDSERNDGSAEKPFFMEDGLKQFIEQSKKQNDMSAKKNQRAV